MFSDSMDKIINSYFACITKQEFIYKNRIIYPKPLASSNLLFRKVSCPELCGGCCSVFSLDYLSNERNSDFFFNIALEKRKIILNNKSFFIYSDLQKENKKTKCKYLDKKIGRCTIHGNHPFTCDFELIRPLQYKNPKRPNNLITKLYGRGWNMLRIDGNRGALCSVGYVTKESINDIKRKIIRLNEWCDYFKIKSYCEDIIKWIEKGNIHQKIIFK